MPAFNAEKYIRAAIESVLDNGFDDLELVVVDDGSADGTARVVESIAHPALRLLRQPENLGVGATRQRGVAQLRGTYMAALDADDIAVPGRFARQVARLEAAGGPDILGGAIEHFGDAQGQQFFPLTDAEIRAAFLFFDLPLANGSVCLRLSPLREGRIHYGAGSGAEDYALWADAMFEGLRFENLPVVVTRVRRHAQSLTRQSFDAVVAQSRVVRQRIAEKLFPLLSAAEHAVLAGALSSNLGAGQRWVDGVYALSHAAMLVNSAPRVDAALLLQLLEKDLLRMLQHAKDNDFLNNDLLEMMTEVNPHFERWRAAGGGLLDMRIMALAGA